MRAWLPITYRQQKEKDMMAYLSLLWVQILIWPVGQVENIFKS